MFQSCTCCSAKTVQSITSYPTAGWYSVKIELKIRLVQMNTVTYSLTAWLGMAQLTINCVQRHLPLRAFERIQEGEHAASAQKLTFLFTHLALTPPAQVQTITCAITDMETQTECIPFNSRVFFFL